MGFHAKYIFPLPLAFFNISVEKGWLKVVKKKTTQFQTTNRELSK